ncbi:MAG: Lrp/AsnC family transcriptional regulator [Thermodesulfobacteriota bacterium]|nr:Lrp/AsnC family transcriptional regulator [Thermodesulfobacteriota bacterium]
MLNLLEKKIISALQGDIPVTETPFKDMAEDLGISEEKFIEIAENLKRAEVIRRFGATLKHQKSGYSANAMVAWQVDVHRAKEVGEKMASFDEVTHCYKREPVEEWPYNLYTMIHAGDEKGCFAIAEKISRAVLVDDYALLFSRRELKKTSMKYFDGLKLSQP